VVAPVSGRSALIVSLDCGINRRGITQQSAVPAVSVALAVKMWLPSVSGPVVKVQLPPLIVAAQVRRAVEHMHRRQVCVADRPDSASVLSLVAPPLEIVAVARCGADVLLIDSLGGVCRPSR